MDEQRRVAAFLATHDMETEPAYRLLDLSSELGELAKEVCTSTDYGHRPDDVTVPEDELGDVLFALLALAEELDVDAGTALESSLAKYERRIEETGDAGSGR
ncbi:MazG nucleotide pyrophosphohydrolase domain-containing protein [Haloarchaeobius salinus]|uniref:MazG nucleotide pyrophosphohydrolase domain-containing protein n=1 Tax=Haloarchaeobius salinus TaxID=1198298 RepID=UPI00210D37B5|nr:MazG nucleotide pyrophosphohydrolase domain-containing protein [Haloarchaeobius salinus]